MTVFVSAQQSTVVLTSHCSSALWKTSQKGTSFVLKCFQVAFCRVQELEFDPSHRSPRILVATFSVSVLLVKKIRSFQEPKREG